jgi:hypothetical protein
MTKLLTVCLMVALGVLAQSQSVSAEEGIAHMVFFKLKDASPKAKQKLVDACDKYLSKHPGTVYYSAGVRAEEMDREVNDSDFHVALHVVFANKEAHDAYQKHERHLKFIDENKDNWDGVRVFDSHVPVKK